jgi:hypothetical protein
MAYLNFAWELCALVVSIEIPPKVSNSTINEWRSNVRRRIRMLGW